MAASRWLSWTVAFLLGGIALLLGLFALSVGAIAALSRTESGQSWLSARLSAALSDDHQKVEIKGLTDLPFDARAADVTIADGEGVWLEASDLAFAWSPGALLRGGLDIDEATIKTVRLSRLPEADESEQASTSLPKLPEPPRFLAATTIDRFAIDQLDVEPAVLGEAATFNLGGSLKKDDENDIWTGDLDFERTDASTTTVKASGTFDPATEELSVTLDGEDQGLLSTLSGKPSGAPIQISLDGQGSVNDWKGDIRIDLQEMGSFDGVLMAALGDETKASLQGQLSLEPPADSETSQGQKALLALLEEPLALDVTLQAQDDETYTIDPLNLTNSAVDLSAQIALDDERQISSAKGNLVLPSIRPIATAFDQEGDGRGRLDLDMTAIEDSQGFEIGFDGGIDDLGQVPDVLLSLLGPAPGVTGNLRYLLQQDVTIDDLKLEGDGLNVTGNAALGAGNDGELAADLSISLPELERLEAALGQPITGSAELKAKLAGTKTKPAVDIDGTVSAEREGVELEGDLEIDGKADLTGEGQAEGQATLKALGVLLEATVDAEDLGPTPTLNGEFNLGEFDPSAVVTALGGAYNPADETVLKSAALKLTFAGQDGKLVVEPIEGHIDDTKLDGRIDIGRFEPPDVTLKLHTNRLDLDRYKPSEEKDPSSGSSDGENASEDGGNGLDTEALAEQWSDLGFKGVLQIDELILNTQSTKDLEINLNWDP